ncbi:MAG: gluconate transporter [Chitinophaga sp.]|jgi:Gnt-I system high-affinity gluconate transporter|nr:gluconate transporter [Chitinophaga sp.]
MQILIIVAAIIIQVFLTVKKINPFLSLLTVSIIAGLCLGIQPAALISSIEKGVSSTMGSIALVISLGAVLGKILEQSGAVEKIAVSLINSFGQKNIQWAALLTGFLIGIPLYYNAAFVILVPLMFMLTRKTGLPFLYIAIPMAASLSTTHCFLPPHPGPMVLIAAFKADVGKTLVLGICMAIPAVVIAGPLLGAKLKRINVSTVFNEKPFSNVEETKTPSSLISFFVASLPVILIGLSVIAENFLTGSLLKTILIFIGNTNIALLISVIAALYFFGWKEKVKTEILMQWMTLAVNSVAMILLIITAGSIFKQVIIDSGTGNYIASFSQKLSMPPLIFAWVITALLRVSVGSATVAGITAAGVVAPLINQHHVSPELMVLAVGAGSVFGSHVNDPGFWMYKEFFKLSLKQTFLSWTVMETIISVVGLGMVLLLNIFI